MGSSGVSFEANCSISDNRIEVAVPFVCYCIIPAPQLQWLFQKRNGYCINAVAKIVTRPQQQLAGKIVRSGITVAAYYGTVTAYQSRRPTALFLFMKHVFNGYPGAVLRGVLHSARNSTHFRWGGE